MINLGLDYGKSAFSVKDDLKTTQEEAQRLIDIIKSKTPKKQEYFAGWQSFVEKNGYIITDDLVFSRTWFDGYEEYTELRSIPYNNRTKEQSKRFFKLKGQMERFAQNNRIQGSAALMTKIAHIMIDNELERRNLQDKAWVCGLIHDEIVVDSQDEIKEEVAIIMQTCMINSGKLFCKTIPMKVDPEIDKEWHH